MKKYKDVKLITDSKKVEKWKDYIQKNQVQESKGNLPYAEMIEKVKEDDASIRYEVYETLRKSYWRPTIKNSDEELLVKQILENISIKEDEETVVQLAGYWNYPGSLAVFEKHLLSGKADRIGRLIYWLGNEGKSEKTLDYIKELLEKEEIDFSDMDEYQSKSDPVIDGLSSFSEQGNEEIKEKVLSIARNIYNQKLIPEEQFEHLDNGWAEHKPIADFMKIFLTLDDEKVIPLAKKYLKKNVLINSSLKALFRLKDECALDKLLELLNDKEHRYWDRFHTAVDIYTQIKNEELLKAILLGYERVTDNGSYEREELVDALKQMNIQGYENKIEEFLSDKKVIRLVKKTLKLTNNPFAQIMQDLEKGKLINRPIPEDIVKEFQKKKSFERSTVFELLSELEIASSFDGEAGLIPVDYDDLIGNFVENSEGKLKNLLFCMDAKMDEDNYCTYKIYAYLNEVIYCTEPEDQGDWYDVESIVNLLHAILDNNGHKERYNFIDTGDQSAEFVFGLEKNVRKFIEKYNLEDEEKNV